MNKTKEEKLETDIALGQSEAAGVKDGKIWEEKKKVIPWVMCDDGDDDGEGIERKISLPITYHMSIH